MTTPYTRPNIRRPDHPAELQRRLNSARFWLVLFAAWSIIATAEAIRNSGESTSRPGVAPREAGQLPREAGQLESAAGQPLTTEPTAP